MPEDDPNQWVWTCTVWTRPASGAAGNRYDRSPLILPEMFWEHWLDLNLTDTAKVQARSIPSGVASEPYEVSTAVNGAGNDNHSLLEPVAGWP
ncbi:SOS response-associated peptidase family protein [Rhodococcus erythropolis]|nr:SOS response-associated peptidase family protein [Rhodococcus erythropolis]